MSALEVADLIAVSIEDDMVVEADARGNENTASLEISNDNGDTYVITVRATKSMGEGDTYAFELPEDESEEEEVADDILADTEES